MRKIAFLLSSALLISGCATPLVMIEDEKEAVQIYDASKFLYSNRNAGNVSYYDGKVAFSANVGSKENPNYEIFVANEDGSNQKRLTYNNDQLDIEPLWTKDGKIVFQKVGGEDEDVVSYYLIDPATREIKKKDWEDYKNAQ